MIAFRTPPIVRPYSGMYPPLMTLTSLTNSEERGVPIVQLEGLPTDSQSTR